MTDGLFNPEAFEQMPGQIALEQVACVVCGDPLDDHWLGSCPDFPVAGRECWLKNRDESAVWNKTTIVRVYNDGAVIEVRHPYARSNDPSATILAYPNEISEFPR